MCFVLCKSPEWYQENFYKIFRPVGQQQKKKIKNSVVPRGFPLARFSFALFWGQGRVASLPHGVFFAWLFCLWIMRMGFLRVVLLPGASFLGGHVPGCRILRAREELSTA